MILREKRSRPAATGYADDAGDAGKYRVVRIATSVLEPGDHAIVRTNYATNLETGGIGADSTSSISPTTTAASTSKRSPAPDGRKETRLIWVTCPHNPTGMMPISRRCTHSSTLRIADVRCCSSTDVPRSHPRRYFGWRRRCRRA
jgi:hypothetical protein